MTITTADCIREIVKACQDPRAVVAAYCGGTLADYNDPVRLMRGFAQFHVIDSPPYPSQELVMSLCTDPENWECIMEQPDYYDRDKIERLFDCQYFDDQFRAYVYEKHGRIVEVRLAGE